MLARYGGNVAPHDCSSDAQKTPPKLVGRGGRGYACLKDRDYLEDLG